MNPRKKILFFTSRIPYPLEKGDKLRAYYQIKYLSKKCDIVLCCISQDEISEKAKEELSKYTTNIHVYKTSKASIFLNMLVAGFMKFPFQVGYFFNTGAHFFFNNVIKQEKPDHIFVQLIRMAEYASKVKGVSKSLDYMDTFSKGMERRKEKAKGIRKLVFSLEHKRLKKYEAKSYQKFNNTYIISEQDKNSFEFPESNGIKVSPNGIDHAFFSSNNSTEKKYDLLFTGNMSYPPNVNAVIYIAKNILPIIQKEKPEVKLLIAGANPNSAVKGLASENIIVSGWMDDIRDAYNSSKVFLAPLQIGTGLQNKLLEAMSMELPCVTSQLANNALNADPNNEILIGESPEEYAKLVLSLLKSDSSRERLAKNGKEFVVKTFDWETISENLYNDFFEASTK